VFDLSIWKILVLALIGLVVFGPEQLPKFAGQAGRALRELRRLAEGAKTELQGSLGPEFQDFDLADLNPKTFVRKHLFDDVNGNGNGNGHGNGSAGDMSGYGAEPGSAGMSGHGGLATESLLQRGESPPYDAEAT
jgi:sec-independent protein translocase protein TatB